LSYSGQEEGNVRQWTEDGREKRAAYLFCGDLGASLVFSAASPFFASSFSRDFMSSLRIFLA